MNLTNILQAAMKRLDEVYWKAGYSERYLKIMARIKEHYKVAEEKGYETVGIFLQGSQNYNLDTEESDVDTKVIVIPKFDDFLFNKKPTNYTHIMENDEHVDFKDIRLMFKCFEKQNINFVEILFTNYFILNPKYEDLFSKLQQNAEKIARYNKTSALNCIAGMAHQKYTALTHPYPSTKEKIEAYGYDPKQLHHILRLREFIERYVNGEPYADCHVSQQRQYLTGIKQGVCSLEEAEKLAGNNLDEIISIKNNYLDEHNVVVDESVTDILEKTSSEIIKRSFIEELKQRNEI